MVQLRSGSEVPRQGRQIQQEDARSTLGDSGRLHGTPSPVRIVLLCRFCSLFVFDSMTGSLIMRLTYGIDVKDENDPYIHTAENALKSIAAAGNANSQLGKYPSYRQKILLTD